MRCPSSEQPGCNQTVNKDESLSTSSHYPETKPKYPRSEHCHLVRLPDDALASLLGWSDVVHLYVPPMLAPVTRRDVHVAPDEKTEFNIILRVICCQPDSAILLLHFVKMKITVVTVPVTDAAPKQHEDSWNLNLLLDCWVFTRSIFLFFFSLQINAHLLH